MIYEITSKKTKKVQVVDEKTWKDIVARDWAKRFTVVEMMEKKLKPVPTIEKPIEIIKKVEPKKQKNG
jgi:CRISPR/Cas system CSM-associated protein Csm4 (group 5 of RAMP superfamily)